MQFGFTLKPEHTPERTLALTRQAEAAGFEYGWLFDTHVLFREPYVLLTLMAQATTRLRLRTCLPNPATADPSLTASSFALPHRIPRRRVALHHWSRARDGRRRTRGGGARRRDGAKRRRG